MINIIDLQGIILDGNEIMNDEAEKNDNNIADVEDINNIDCYYMNGNK